MDLSEAPLDLKVTPGKGKSGSSGMAEINSGRSGAVNFPMLHGVGEHPEQAMNLHGTNGGRVLPKKEAFQDKNSLDHIQNVKGNPLPMHLGMYPDLSKGFPRLMHPVLGLYPPAFPMGMPLPGGVPNPRPFSPTSAQDTTSTSSSSRPALVNIGKGTKRRAQISVMDKVRIIERYHGGESASNIAHSLGIGQSTVCEIIGAEEVITEMYREKGQAFCETHYQVSWPHYGKLEGALREWLSNFPPEDLPVNHDMIKFKATEIANDLGIKSFVPSKSWLNRFHKKNWKYFGDKSKSSGSKGGKKKRNSSQSPDEESNGSITGSTSGSISGSPSRSRSESPAGSFSALPSGSLTKFSEPESILGAGELSSSEKSGYGLGKQNLSISPPMSTHHASQLIEDSPPEKGGKNFSTPGPSVIPDAKTDENVEAGFAAAEKTPLAMLDELRKKFDPENEEWRPIDLSPSKERVQKPPQETSIASGSNLQDWGDAFAKYLEGTKHKGVPPPLHIGASLKENFVSPYVNRPKKSASKRKGASETSPSKKGKCNEQRVRNARSPKNRDRAAEGPPQLPARDSSLRVQVLQNHMYNMMQYYQQQSSRPGNQHVITSFHGNHTQQREIDENGRKHLPIYYYTHSDIVIKECVAVSINICPWLDPMQFGIKVAGTPCGTPGCRWDVTR